LTVELPKCSPADPGYLIRICLEETETPRQQQRTVSATGHCRYSLDNSSEISIALISVLVSSVHTAPTSPNRLIHFEQWS
jgi:hypothetical protein